MEFLVKKGVLVDPAAGRFGEFDLKVENGRVIEVGRGLSTKGEIVNAKDKYVFPGAIDMHVHFREPGEEYKETILTGSKAAAHGGVTTVLCMPNTKPPCDDETKISYVMEIAKRADIRVFQAGSITKGHEGKEISPFGRMKRAGAIAVSDDGNPIFNSLVMRRALEYAKTFSLVLIDHCEDKNLSDGGYINEGVLSLKTGIKGIPSAAEEIFVARDIILASFVGYPIHTTHISTMGSINLIRDAKNRKLPVDCDVAIHHFTFTEEDVRITDTSFKVNPPIRSKADRDAIREAISDGYVDCIISDHAPHSDIEKDTDPLSASFGISSLDFFLPLCYSLVIDGVIDVSKLVSLISFNPSKILKIKGVGTLKEGSFADFVIFDQDEEEVITVDNIFSKGKNCPYLNKKVRGKVKATYVNGKKVYGV